MLLPSQDQIDAGVQAMIKVHCEVVGYKRVPHTLEPMLWAALFAMWKDWQSPAKFDNDVTRA